MRPPVPPSLVVGTMLAVQTLVSLGMMMLPAIAPLAAPALGVPAALLGAQIGLLYACAAVTSLLSGRCVRRFGAVRTSQAALGLVAVGMIAITTQGVPLIAAGTIALGVAYGLPGPAASHLLTRFTAPKRRNLIFSIKQTGVPLGGALAGLSGPALAQAHGWRTPLFVTAAAALTLAALFGLVRAAWDDDRDAGLAIMSMPFAGLSTLRSPALRSLASAGFLLAGVQVSIMAFVVLLLVEDYGFSPVAAGATMAAVQAAGVAGRILWGFCADWIVAGFPTLALLGSAITAFAFSVTLIGPGEGALIVFVLVALGATAIGWNGVYLVETARLAPEGRVGEATALVLAATYLGVSVGPALFAAAVPILGGYRAAFILLAVVAAGAVPFAVWTRRREQRS